MAAPIATTSSGFTPLFGAYDDDELGVQHRGSEQQNKRAKTLCKVIPTHFAKEVADDILHLRHPGHPPNKKDFIDLAFIKAGVFDALAAWFQSAVDVFVRDLRYPKQY